MKNQNKILHPTRRSFLKVLYNISQIGKKTQHSIRTIIPSTYSRTKNRYLRNSSVAVFVIDSSYTQKGHYFRAALQEATDAFNAVLRDFD